MRCTSCKYDNRAGRRFCAGCGATLTAGCPACGAPNEADERFCGDCGKPLQGAAAAPAAAEPERRKLTVMFCDLVASTALAERVDDDDLRDVIRRFYDVCAEGVGRYEGHVANYLGDGLLAYFGYPRAHEDDAERAVRAALEILATLERDLNPALVAAGGVALSVRIGIHTGRTIVGDLGGGSGAQTSRSGRR